MGRDTNLDQRVRRTLLAGTVINESDAAVYRNLVCFAALVLDRDVRELRLRDLVAHIQARAAWPHPLRRATDRVKP